MKKVLIADDNKYMLDALQEIIQIGGYRAEVADVDRPFKLSNELPDLILMDLRMPRMDGFEAIKIIRSEDKTAAIPIIAISAWASAKHKERALAAGANEHFTKPVDLNRLLTTINRYLKG